MLDDHYYENEPDEEERPRDVKIDEAEFASSWRPITMLVFVAIIANNYTVAPYLEAMFHVGLTLTIPPDMWDSRRP